MAIFSWDNLPIGQKTRPFPGSSKPGCSGVCNGKAKEDCMYYYPPEKKMKCAAMGSAPSCYGLGYPQTKYCGNWWESK